MCVRLWAFLIYLTHFLCILSHLIIKFVDQGSDYSKMTTCLLIRCLKIRLGHCGSLQNKQHEDNVFIYFKYCLLRLNTIYVIQNNIFAISQQLQLVTYIKLGTNIK